MNLGLISLDFPTWNDCIEAAISFELGHVELYLTRGDVREEYLERVSGKCHEAGITIHSLSCLSQLSQAEEDLPNQVAAIERCIDLAAKFGVKNVGFMYGGNDHLDRIQARKRFLGRVEPLIFRAESAGIFLLVENVFNRFPAGDLDTVEHTLLVYEELPMSVRLNFDFGNFAIAGEEAYPYAFECLKDRIGGIHLKDVTRFRDDSHYEYGRSRPLNECSRGLYVTVPVGAGSLNSAAILETLASWPGSPPVMLEPFRDAVSREQWLHESLEFIRRVV